MENPSFQKATDLLKEKLPDSVMTGPDELAPYAYDGSKLAFTVDALIRPQKESEIGQVLELANEHKVPVTVRGGGSSLTGSASPFSGGWVLDLSSWEGISVNRAAGMATVQAGAKIADIQKAAEAEGWFYPPDPSSHRYSTIGGNLACNAGGMRGGKYGVTRDYVLALRGFLPTGEAVRWARPLRKYAAGYNFRDLWVGSEGTLGVIVEATLRLVPKPKARWTILACFESEAKALDQVKLLWEQQVIPSITEFLDRESVSCAERATGAEIFAGQKGRPVLLIELDGHPAAVEEDRQQVLAILGKSSLAWKEAADENEAQSLWEVRRKCSGAMFELGDAKLNEDVVVPLERERELIEFTRALSQEKSLPIAVFGHAGDGNFHVNIMFYRDHPEQSANAEEAVQSLMEKVLQLGGTISGEHGIGLAKTPFFAMEHSPAEIKAMEAVKKALDPQGILNPGKLFTPYEVWRHRPVKVRLPWDHK
ncbi:MAG: FAD-binding oxidoreductase [Opitutales bacterium]|nr:FAD-binding oxidoreductase [Opitutales bacterium]